MSEREMSIAADDVFAVIRLPEDGRLAFPEDGRLAFAESGALAMVGGGAP